MIDEELRCEPREHITIAPTINNINHHQRNENKIEEEEELEKSNSDSESSRDSSDENIPKSSCDQPFSKQIGKVRVPTFDGAMYDAIDGTPIVIEDGKVCSMKSLWEHRRGKY